MSDHPKTGALACAPADPNPRPARFTVPPGAVDCHAHVFGPSSRYPFVAARNYTPPEAPLACYKAMLRTLGVERAVLVQPSVYGSNHCALLDALEEAGSGFRAIAVLDEGTQPDVLRRFQAAGVRGVRVNLLFASGVEISSIETLAALVAPLGWHIQVLLDVSRASDLLPVLGRLPVPVVFDHMGHMPTHLGPDHPGFMAMVRLLESGRAWVKLSGAYRITDESLAPYRDVRHLARRLIEANPENLVWATDWPHPQCPVPMPNDGELLDMLDDWAADTEVRDRILTSNAHRLYDF